MADGLSRSGAGLGVVAATSGGGCLNTVAGLGEALASRVPVLALIGQPPTTLDGRGAFQDTSGRNGALNGEALFSAVSVFCRRIMAPEEIATALPEAIAAANRGGPAVLLLPKDIQQSSLDFDGSVNGRHQRVGDRGCSSATRRPSRGRCGSADGPITIIAGEQVARDDARAELAQLRSMLRARVATVPDAKDVAGTPGLGSSSALGSDRGDGTSRGREGDRRQRALPTGRHAVERDRARRAGRRAGIGADVLDRVGGAVRAVHARPNRGPARVAETAHAGIERRWPADGCARAGRGGKGRAATAATRRRWACGTARRWPCSMPRCRMASTSSSTPGTSARRRSITYLPVGTDDSSSRSAWVAWDTASAPRWVWRSDADAGPWLSRVTAHSSCTAWRFTPLCSTDCR